MNALASAEMPLERLAGEITLLYANLTAAMCHWLLLVGEFDTRDGWAGEGVESCAHWLNWRCGISLRTAREHVRVAHALEGLPVIRAAFSRGEISYSKARAITRVASPESQETLLMWARHSTAHHLDRIVSTFHRHERQKELSDARLRHLSRSLRTSYSEDGQGHLTIDMDPEDLAYVMARIEGELASLPKAEADTPRPARLVDAFLNLLREGSEATDDAQVIVHADVEN